MKFFDGLKELINNFTKPITDVNIQVDEIADDEFVAIANASGISQKEIKEMLKSRNGVQLPKQEKNRETNKTNIEKANKVNEKSDEKVERKGYER